MAWNRPQEKPQPVAKKPTVMRGVVAGVICVAVLGIAAFFIFSGDAPAPSVERKSSGKIKEVKPASAPKQEEVVQEEQPLDVAKPPKPKYVGHVTTQSFARVVTLADGTVTNLKSRVAFTNRMEQVLSCALNPRGIAVPLRLALRRYSEDQIREMFHTDLKPEKGDDEFILSHKLELQELKMEVRDLEKQGLSYTEIFDEIDKIGRNARAEIKAARQGLSQLIKAGESPEVLKAWVDEKNAVLKELGEPPLRVPEQFLEQAE